ncbi:hypothetical protein PWG71_24205 [Nocardiopsis sp. N85]|nr:hypothetical protein [Nocardiopsis sp. N85]MDE3724506.1 hypothetical protein [Nocardiopsis sp. N85]
MATLISLFALFAVVGLTWWLTGKQLPSPRADRDTIRRLSKLGDRR